jgi:hypothetical protein
MFNLKHLNEVEGKGTDRDGVSDRVSASEYIDSEVDINSACETVIENTWSDTKVPEI